MEQTKTNQKLIYIILGLILILGIGFLGWYLFIEKQITQEVREAKKINYIIPGVPYFGIYNHKGELSYISGDTASAVASVLEYWNPGKNNLVEINRAFRPQRGVLIGERAVKSFIENYSNYQAERVVLDINEIKNYINPKTKTPLFLFLAIDENQPLTVVYRPATILIGIKESEQKLVFHSFWSGNNYEITYDVFNKLQKRMRPDERNTYLVIKPKNIEEKLKEINQRTILPYPERTSIMKEAETMFKNYAIGSGANYLRLDKIAVDYLGKVINDSKFESYFPPYFKVMVLYRLGESYLEQKDYSNALIYTNKAIELNHDLNQPFKDWPGYDIRTNKPDVIDRISGPYRVLGDIYKELKDFKKAKESYERALDINPTNPGAIRNLQIVELEIAKTK